MKYGIILSLITVVLWSLERVISRYTLITFNVDPLLFTCFSLFVCSIILIIIAGPGEGGLNTLKKPHTWSYGILQVLTNISGMMMLALITSTEASFLTRTTIIMALLMKWAFFEKSKPNKYDFLGMPLVLAGIFVVAIGLPEGIRGPALVWMFFTALFYTLRTMIAETHPTSQKANTIKSRCRVTGYVVMITSFSLIFSLFLFAFLKGAVPSVATLPIVMNLPTFADIMHQPTLFAATIMGATILPFAMYFYFYTARVAKTEVFMMVTSIQPFLAFGLESTLNYFGMLDIQEITQNDLIAGVIIVLGAVIMISGRFRKSLQEKIMNTKKLGKNVTFKL